MARALLTGAIGLLLLRSSRVDRGNDSTRPHLDHAVGENGRIFAVVRDVDHRHRERSLEPGLARWPPKVAQVFSMVSRRRDFAVRGPNGTLVMVFVAAVTMQVVAGAQAPCTAVEVASGQCVVVIGKVERAGIYGFEAGLTVQQAIEKAGGIAEDPYGFSLIVWRLVEGQRTQLDTTLDSALQPNDVLEVKPEPAAIPPPMRMPTELLKSLLFGRSAGR
jgi:hypothetical protein